MSYCVGLTGSIASGKSTVGKIFASFGIDLFSSDVIARELTQKNAIAWHAIVKQFGADILKEDGELDRAFLRRTVFENPIQRIWLEQLLHPLIREALKTQADTMQSPYCIIEIPLLYNREDYPWLNRILVVQATENIALERIMCRDNCTLEQAKTILALQHSKVNYGELADDLLVNNGDLMSLEAEVLELHEIYLGFVDVKGKP